MTGTFFNIAFEKSLRNLREKMNKRKPAIEHSYAETTNPSKELIFADDSDFPTLSKAEMKETMAEDDLIVNEGKTVETIMKRLKEKNDEE